MTSSRGWSRRWKRRTSASSTSPRAATRDQVVPLESQQAGGVARNRPRHRLEQPVVPIGAGQRGRQVAGDLQQCLELVRVVVSLITSLSILQLLHTLSVIITRIVSICK